MEGLWKDCCITNTALKQVMQVLMEGTAINKVPCSSQIHGAKWWGIRRGWKLQ